MGEEAGEEEGEEAEEEGQEEEEEKEGQEEEEKEEKEEEEEGRQVPGRQAAEGRAQEEGCWALRREDAVRRPGRDLRQEQDVPPGDREIHLGLHQEEQAQQGPDHHAGREAEEGPARQLVEHVKDAGDVWEAHQVSARSRVRSIGQPCSAWRNLMTFRRCRVHAIFDPWT